jgi:hypothetical protein
LVNINDQPRLGTMLEEVCAMFSKPYHEVLLHAYYRVLREQSFEAVSKAMIRILTDESRRQVMPTAAEIKAIARHFETVTGEQRYLPCQQPACGTLVAWPPMGPVNEHSYYCPRHTPAWQPEWDREKHNAERHSVEDKREIFARATPKAKALLRSIAIVAKHMTDIPITPEEQAVTDADTIPLRANAFKDTATGPGVNAGVFLNGQVTEDTAWIDGYRKGSEIVVAAGFTYDARHAVWKRGRQTLTDDQIGRMDEEVLRMFVGRR